MPPQTWVARFVVDHGQVTEEGGRLRSFPRRRLDEPEIDLHLLAEPAGPNDEEFAGQALEAIGRDFLKDTLSITGGLMRALRSTNQVLLDWNRRSIAREQVAVGITAAAVRGTTVFFAQAGPAVAFLRRAGKLSRLVPQESASTALGEGQIEPELRRLELEPGDVLIAASRAIESIVDRYRLDALLARGTESALPELYLASRDLPKFALFAVACLEGQADPQPQEPEEEPAEILRPRTVTADGEPPEPVLTFEPAGAEDATPKEPVLVAPKPLDISRPVVRLRSDQFSSRNDYPRTTGTAKRFRFDLPAARLFGIAAAVGLAVFIAAFTVPDLIQENRQEQAANLVERAFTTFSAYESEQDPARKRTLVEETRRLASEALRLEPGNVAAGELRQQTSTALTALDNITDLGAMETITTLGNHVTGEIAVERIVIGSGNAYLLDTQGRRIILVPLSLPGPPVVLFEENQTYGGAIARRPQHIAWDSSQNRLLLLDSERKLFDVRPGAVQPLALRRANSWTSVSGIEAYDGNLYVLDPAGNQIHRYLPAASGFDSEPTTLLSNQAAISNTEAFAVQGDIFLLTEDGGIRRFRGGGESTLRLAGIDRALDAPSAIVAVPDSDLYIADSGNKRIVVVDREGVFRRQLVSNAFTDLRPIAVDPTVGRIYVVVRDAVLASPLPR
jgi:hypothetical protein